MGQGFRAQHELILHFVKGTARFHSAMHGNVLDVPRMDHRQREHPTQKPIQLMQCLIETTTPSGGVVLDPFAGSGTTLAAAKLLGRRAIGFERDERFCEIAAKRISHDAVPLV
jgi:site-specific DNA-methyltransferase (adenine-specific)